MRKYHKREPLYVKKMRCESRLEANKAGEKSKESKSEKRKLLTIKSFSQKK